MSVLARGIETVAVITGGLAAGYAARRFGLLSECLSPRITRRTLTYLEPVPIILSLWGLQIGDFSAFALPALGIAMMLAMWPVGHLFGRALGLVGRDLAAFIGAAMFSNVGITYGTFLCYALLGDRGVALGYLYCASFMLGFFTIGFVMAAMYAGGGAGLAGPLRELFTRPESRNPLIAVFVGLALFFAPVQRPSFGGIVVEAIVPVTTFLYMLAIGLSLHPRRMAGYWRAAGAMHVVKFIVSPAIGLLLARAVGYGPGSELLKVMFIQSATPAAIMSLVLAQARELNVDLANACWLATNLSAIALAPLWLYIASTL